MRFALVLVMCSIVPSVASADGPKVPFVDVLNVASQGDFAAYEGQRHDGAKLVPHRVFVRVVLKVDTNTRLVWFQGEKGKEARFHGKALVGRANPIDQIADIAAAVTKARADAIKDVTLEAGTCTLAKDVACTIVRFKLDGHDVVAGMSATVRALGIASLEIKHPTKGVMWKLRVTGYGRDKAPEWGTVLPAELAEKETGKGETNVPKAPAPSLVIGEPITTGGDLDKAIIRRYVKRSAQKLSYCYEKELIAKPQIQGVVTVKFEIQTTGIVSTASGSGVDSNVAECAVLVIKGIEFPKPKDKAVSVVYAFTFKPS